MEPDHSASIPAFLQRYPETVVVSTTMGFKYMEQFFPEIEIAAEKRIIAANSGTLELGSHTLHFVYAPMVHWPEVMMTYEASEKILFAADGFGKFGALDVEEDWVDEARRYYIGIVGKYGAQVQAVLKKASTLDIQTICSLHGPVLKDNLGFYLEKYDKWSSYQPEESGVVIAYASVYGNTKKAAQYLADKLSKSGVKLPILFYHYCWEMGSIFLFTAPYPCPGAVSAPAGGVRCPQQISPGTASSNCLG